MARFLVLCGSFYHTALVLREQPLAPHELPSMMQSKEHRAPVTSSDFIKNMKAFKHASYPQRSEHLTHRTQNPNKPGLIAP